MRGTGRPTQLPGRVRVNMKTLDPLRGVSTILVKLWLRAVELARDDVKNAVEVVC